MEKSALQIEKNELLRELEKLNRTGLINDEEFVYLRKFIRGGSLSPEFRRRFESLFGKPAKQNPADRRRD